MTPPSSQFIAVGGWLTAAAT